MPLPTVKKNETEQEFVSRCVASKVIRKEFPDQKQALGVCYSIYRQKKKKQSKGSSEPINWQDVEEEIQTDGFILG